MLRPHYRSSHTECVDGTFRTGDCGLSPHVHSKTEPLAPTGAKCCLSHLGIMGWTCVCVDVSITGCKCIAEWLQLPLQPYALPCVLPVLTLL
jgi:hypothetical protein